MLGQQLKTLLRSGDEATVVALLPDIVLLARAKAVARARNRGLSEIVTEACRRFADHGSEDDWTSYMGLLRSGGDPGPAFVASALRRHLEGGCGCGGGCG